MKMAECTNAHLLMHIFSDSETKKTPKMPSEPTDSYALLGAQIHPKFQIPRPSASFGVCQNSDSIALEIPFISNFQLLFFRPRPLKWWWLASDERGGERSGIPPLFLSLKGHPQWLTLWSVIGAHAAAARKGGIGAPRRHLRRARGTCMDRGGRD